MRGWLRADGGSGNEDPFKGRPPGGGKFRVLLLNSPKHTEPLVVGAITRVGTLSCLKGMEREGGGGRGDVVGVGVTSEGWGCLGEVGRSVW